MIKDIHFRDTEDGRKATIDYAIRGRAHRVVVACTDWIAGGDVWMWNLLHANAQGVDARTLAALE